MTYSEESRQTSPLLPDPASMGTSTPSNFKMLGKIGFVPGWEGLRGFAVALVMFSHVVENSEMLGILGVGIFFVLSGFLITGVLMAQIEKQQLAASTHEQASLVGRFAYLPRFYMDRFVRLTPALAMMVGTIYYCAPNHPIIGKDALCAFFYIHNYYPVRPEDPRLMFPGIFLNTWSLAVEEQFYIFWSLVIAFIVPLPLQKRAIAIGALIGGSFCVRWYSGYAFLGDHMYGIDYRYAYSSNAFKMFLGCAARLVPMPIFCTRPITGMISTLSLFVLVWVWGWGAAAVGFDLRTTGCWLELFTCIVSLFAVTGSIHGNWLMELQAPRFLGRISYSLYLWQFPIHALWYWPIRDWSPTGYAFAIATFTTFTIEEPIRNAYHAWKNGRTSHSHTRHDEVTEKTSDARRVD